MSKSKVFETAVWFKSDYDHGVLVLVNLIGYTGADGHPKNSVELIGYITVDPITTKYTASFRGEEYGGLHNITEAQQLLEQLVKKQKSKG